MRTRVILPGVLLAACAVVAACGGPAPSSPDTTTAPSASASASTGGSSITVVYVDEKAESTTWQLTCDPAGGDIPDPTAACAALTKNAATALPEPSKDTMCTQVFGGPQTAVLTGTWRGEPVNSRLNRKNGCEIARWEALVGLLPRVEG
jgi:hypothetical protein